METKVPDLAGMVDRIDFTPILVSIATDMAGTIRKRLREKQVKPALKGSTVKAKQRRGSLHADTPLVDSGLLMDSISSRKGARANTAEIYIRDRTYGVAHQGLSSTKKGQRVVWKAGRKQSARGVKYGKKSGGAYPAKLTTNEVARIHNDGFAPNPRREFFFFTLEDLAQSARLRIRQGLAGALRRAGMVK